MRNYQDDKEIMEQTLERTSHSFNSDGSNYFSDSIAKAKMRIEIDEAMLTILDSSNA